MRAFYVMIFILVSTLLHAQHPQQTDQLPGRSIDGILEKMLTIISGEKGKVRDWESFRNLFLPTARFTVLNNSDPLSDSVETVSLEEFIDLMHDQYYEDGYLEQETGKVVNEFNGIANVFQSFYGRDSNNQEEKGINSYQLVYVKKRWWIASLVWVLASKDVPIPAKYLRH